MIKYTNIDIKLSSQGLKYIEKYGDSKQHPIVTKKHITDAGLDLISAHNEDVIIVPFDNNKLNIEIIRTGMCIDLNTPGLEYNKLGFSLYGLITMRSSTPGLNLYNQVGIVDQEYHGEILLKLINITDDIIKINPGDRIAQMVIQTSLITEFSLTHKFKTETIRSNKGFGSTGK